jgi:hypothetical protein
MPVKPSDTKQPGYTEQSLDPEHLARLSEQELSERLAQMEQSLQSLQSEEHIRNGIRATIVFLLIVGPSAIAAHIANTGGIVKGRPAPVIVTNREPARPAPLPQPIQADIHHNRPNPQEEQKPKYWHKHYEMYMRVNRPHRSNSLYLEN